MNHLGLLVLFIASVGLAEAFGATGRTVSTAASKGMDMKIFDWKKRKAFENYEIPEDYVLSVNTIFAIPGSRKRKQRIGRGISAGQGASCGKGMRGQSSRSGGGVRPGFEGGQTPLYRRLPKFVGRTMRGHTRVEYELIKLDMLSTMSDNAEVDCSVLLEQGIITKANKGRKIYKVIGGAVDKEGDQEQQQQQLAKGLTVKAHAFTQSARDAIEAAGGKCVVLSPTRHIPIEEAIADQEKIDAERLVKLKELRKLKAKRNAAREQQMV